MSLLTWLNLPSIDGGGNVRRAFRAVELKHDDRFGLPEGTIVSSVVCSSGVSVVVASFAALMPPTVAMFRSVSSPVMMSLRSMSNTVKPSQAT